MAPTQTLTETQTTSQPSTTTTATTTTRLRASSPSPSPSAEPSAAASTEPAASTNQKQQQEQEDEDEELDIYDDVEIEDMIFDSTLQIYHHPCPCGDRFEIAVDDMRDGKDIAVCPGCSLMIRVIFELSDLPEKDG